MARWLHRARLRSNLVPLDSAILEIVLEPPLQEYHFGVDAESGEVPGQPSREHGTASINTVITKRNNSVITIIDFTGAKSNSIGDALGDQPQQQRRYLAASGLCGSR